MLTYCKNVYCIFLFSVNTSIQESEKDIKEGKYSVYHSAEELKKDIENE